jgi:membrane-associated phospholipid phosphatase
MGSTGFWGVLGVAAAVIAPSLLGAQTPMQGDSVHAAQTLFTWRDAALAGGFAVLTVAMFPIDQRTARHLQDPNTQTSRFLRDASRDVQYVADPGSVVIGLSMYGIGRIAHWRQVADLGLHGSEAVAISGTVTALLKGTLGRARPYVSADTNAHDFGFGRGFGKGGYQSFPSGHTSAAFAAASVVTSESQRWWPTHTWLMGGAMYGGPTLVGLSRMYNNAHWASDVVLGAAIGTFSGIKVVRYSHGHSDNAVDRFFLGLTIAPAPGGASVGFSVAP